MGRGACHLALNNRSLRVAARNRLAAARVRKRYAGCRRRGFTLLEMIVATLVMGVAVVGMLAGLAGAARNAARVRDYDRVVELARLQMNELLASPTGAGGAGRFDPAVTGGLDAGWQARVSQFAAAPNPEPGQFALDRIELEVWWTSGSQRRTLTLDTYRRRLLRPEAPK